MEKGELLQEQAKIREWLFRYGQMHADRDTRIRYAYQLRITQAEIATLVGMTRQTVSRIVGS
jgi:CRP-like cAMP-binding protein